MASVSNTLKADQKMLLPVSPFVEERSRAVSLQPQMPCFICLNSRNLSENIVRMHFSVASFTINNETLTSPEGNFVN